jgi:hypothetical protein
MDMENCQVVSAVITEGDMVVEEGFDEEDI